MSLQSGMFHVKHSGRDKIKMFHVKHFIFRLLIVSRETILKDIKLDFLLNIL